MLYILYIMDPTTYTLQKGTILYRGDTPFYLKNKNQDPESLFLEPNKPIFFALSPDDVQQYGIIYGWEVPYDIVLPLIDNPHVMKEIYDNANKIPDVQTVMRKNYGYNPQTMEIGNRDSIFEKDLVFYRYLCEIGHPGYASNDLEDGQRFSYEIMVCNPQDYACKGLFYPSKVGDKGLYIRNQIQKYNDRIKPKEKHVKSKSILFASPVKGNNLFASPVKGNNLFASPVKGYASPVKRTVKGGKNRINRKKTKSRKHKGR
jgi:hypothetical protein